MATKRIALIYYSLSQQTKRLVDSYSKGLVESGVIVDIYQLKSLDPLRLPLRSNYSLFKAMWLPFWRKRHQLEPLDFRGQDYDYVVLAGPTWSYQPSGPMLSFLDHYGKMITGKRVSFLISCRSYWRPHYWSLKYSCKKLGAFPEKAVVFEHATSEPWCTLGLLLWLRGIYSNKLPKWFQKKYPRYGHSNDQIHMAYREGQLLAQEIL